MLKKINHPKNRNFASVASVNIFQNSSHSKKQETKFSARGNENRKKDKTVCELVTKKGSKNWIAAQVQMSHILHLALPIVQLSVDLY